MGGPSKDRSKGIQIPVDLDLDKPFGGLRRTLFESPLEPGYDEEAQAKINEAERVAPLNLAAKDLGFASEADRIAKVSKIINAFGSTRRKAPRVLAQGATGAGKVV